MSVCCHWLSVRHCHYNDVSTYSEGSEDNDFDLRSRSRDFLISFVVSSFLCSSRPLFLVYSHWVQSVSCSNDVSVSCWLTYLGAVSTWLTHSVLITWQALSYNIFCPTTSFCGFQKFLAATAEDTSHVQTCWLTSAGTTQSLWSVRNVTDGLCLWMQVCRCW